MHEFSIAVNIVEMIEENAAKENVKKVEKFELDIGTLSGVIIDALEFALDEAVKNTICEMAERKINEIKAKARCNDCGEIYNLVDYFVPCPECGGYRNEVITGKEIRLKSITAE